MRFPLVSGALALALTLPVFTADAHALSNINKEWEAKILTTPLAGHLQRVNFASPALEETRPIYVYTPPGYAENSSRTYPVLVLMHGTPGNPIDWLYKGGAHVTLDNAIRSGKMPPCLVVCANGVGPFYKEGSEWTNSYDGRCMMENAISNDLTSFLQTRFHAATNPALWTLAGLSEGGYGAANLTVRHPERFRNALVFSGDMAVSDEWPDARDVFGDNPIFRRQNSPLYQIEHLSSTVRQSLHFYVAIGNSDHRLMEQNEAFAATCNRLNVPLTYVRESGRHSWGFWSEQLRRSMEPLGRWLRESGAN